MTNFITETARRLRRNQTPSEELLWSYLRNRQFEGLKFLRQHPLFYYDYKTQRYLYFADFYCAEKKLVIELDGKIHEETKEKDANRDYMLSERGLKILRISNEELEQIDTVLLKIKNSL